MEQRGPSAYAAEFIGTLFLVFLVSMVLSVEIGGSPSYLDFAVIGLVHAFVLMMIVATLAGASGAHVNPAVTVAMAALRKIAPVDAGIYVVCQLAGGVAGALLVKLLVLDEGKVAHYGGVAISDALSGKAFSGFGAEAIGTFILMWSIMGVAVNPRGQTSLAPLVIGATLGALVMVFGPLTGAGFNPARAFGSDLVANYFNGGGEFFLAYVVGPVVGALAAGFAYVGLIMGPAQSAAE